MAITLLAVIAATLAVSHTGAARVSVPSTTPIVVRGTSFRRYERVRVVVRFAGRVLTARRTATTRGVFVVRFATSLPRMCPPLYVTATGSKGSRATTTFTPENCGPPPPAQ